MSLFGTCPLDGVDVDTLNPGDLVKVYYWSGIVIAKVIDAKPYGRYGPQRGWVEVEQLTDFEDREVKPVYLAAAEFMELMPKCAT